MMNSLDAPITTTIGVDPYQTAVLAQLCQALAGIEAMPGAAAPATLEAGLQAIAALAVTAQSGAGLPYGEWTASLTALPHVGRSLLTISGPQDQLHVQLDSAGMPFVCTWQGVTGFLSFSVEATGLHVMAPVEMAIPMGPVAGWTSAPVFMAQEVESAGGPGVGAGALFAAGGLLVAAAGALLAHKAAAAPAAPPPSAAVPRRCRRCGAVCPDAARFCGACGTAF